MSSKAVHSPLISFGVCFNLLPAALAAVLLSETAQAGIIQHFDTFGNTDWTQAGLGGLRGVGAGTINLSGVSGSVTEAYLYWHGPTNSSSPAANASITFAGSGITGTNIGFSDDNFWGFVNSQAYRADVTSLVPGNGAYAIGNLIKPGVQINGASLVVFFDDGNSANNRDVVMFNGNDANYDNPFDPLGWAATLSGINYTSGTASIQFGVSDGQNFTETFFPTDDPGVRLNGTTLFSPGNVFNGTTVPSAGGPVSPPGALWDIRSFSVTSFLTPGPNTLSLTSFQNGHDALSLIHLAFDLPAGSVIPPEPSPVPEPSSLSLLAMGTLCVSGLRRRILQRRVSVT